MWVILDPETPWLHPLVPLEFFFVFEENIEAAKIAWIRDFEIFRTTIS